MRARGWARHPSGPAVLLCLSLPGFACGPGQFIGGTYRRGGVADDAGSAALDLGTRPVPNLGSSDLGVVDAGWPDGATRPDGGVPDAGNLPDGDVPDPPAPLRIVFVNPSGRDDGAGTANDPLGSISAAAAGAQPGDLIRVASGTYLDNVVIEASGTPEHPIRFVADEAVTLEIGPRFGAGFRIEGSHVEVRGFSVRGEGEAFAIRDGRPLTEDVCADLDAYMLLIPEEQRDEERGVLTTMCGLGGPRGGPNHVATDILIDGRGPSQARSLIELEGDESVGLRIEDEAERVRFSGFTVRGGRYAVLLDFVEVVRRVEGLWLEDLMVEATRRYGLRIIARHPGVFETDPAGPLLAYRSGIEMRGRVHADPRRRTTISDLVVRDNHFERVAWADPTGTGSGEGYGAILMQGIEGGLVERNLIRNPRYWGIDALVCDDVLFRNNLFLFDPGIRDLEPRFNGWSAMGLELNAGERNRVYNNLFVGAETGLFESLFPEDYPVTAFSADIRNNVFVDNITSIARFPSVTQARTGAIAPHQTMIYLPVEGFAVSWQEHRNLMDIGVNVERDGSQHLGGDPEFFGSDNRVVPGLDPLFRDAAAGDYRPAPGSPLIDGGDDLSDVPEDFDGRARPRGRVTDLGPFED